MSFKDLQQTVFPFPHLTQKVRTPFQISDTSNTLFCTNINTKTTTATIILFPLKSRMKEKIVKRVSVYRITTILKSLNRDEFQSYRTIIKLVFLSKLLEVAATQTINYPIDHNVLTMLQSVGVYLVCYRRALKWC